MGKLIDLTGKRFGRWTILKRVMPNTKWDAHRWICKCDCGKIKILQGRTLKNGTSTNCGCWRLDDLTGKTFNRWTVFKRGRDTKAGRPQWVCECECGKTGLIPASNLRSGSSKSCGCFNRDVHTIHGDYLGRCGKPTIEHNTWQHIKERCLNVKYEHYKHYGGRGIKVCKKWINSYETFLVDMGRRPFNKTSIERIDNNGNYEPGNCKWATQKEQTRNTRKNVWLEFNGIRMIKADWLQKLGVTRQAYHYQSNKGLTDEEILKHYMKRMKGHSK